MITLIDYGMGNLGSVQNMFKRLGVETTTARNTDEVSNAEKILLPGVGAFDNAVTRLKDSGLFSALQRFAETGKPLLGICLGMQLLTNNSEEGKLSGLGLIPGITKKFSFKDPLVKIPHMGWNTIIKTQENDIFEYLDLDNRFYFVHSYYVLAEQQNHVLAETIYGDSKFNSMIVHNNILGAQFHPEKSHRFGMQLFKAFSEL